MGTEGKNREQRRKLNKGRAHASKATAIVIKNSLRLLSIETKDKM